MAHKKDAYYFSHDSSASRDIKMLKLKHKHGWHGIGLFWGVVETLRESTDYKLESDEASVKLLSTILGIEYESLQNVLETCYEVGLFENDGKFFYSNSLNERMSQMNRKREIGYANGVLGGRKPKDNPNHNPNVTQTLTQTLTKTEPLKEKKEKKRKEKESKTADAGFFSEDDIKNLTPHEYMDWIDANKALFKPVERITLPSGRKVSKPRLDVPNPFKWGYSLLTGFPDINVLSDEQRQDNINKMVKNGTVQ